MQQLLARQLEVQAHLPQRPDDNDSGEDEDEDVDEDEDEDEDFDNEGGENHDAPGHNAGSSNGLGSVNHQCRHRCPYLNCHRKTPFRSRRALNVHHQRRILPTFAALPRR